MAGNSGGRAGVSRLAQNTAPNPVDNAMQVLSFVSSLFANGLNQLNRIGGADVPVYDPEVGYGQVFKKAGYGPMTSEALGLVTSVLEPGPAEVQSAMRLLPGIAAMMFKPGMLRAAEWSDIYGWVGGPHASEVVPSYYIDREGLPRSPLLDWVESQTDQSQWIDLDRRAIEELAARNRRGR